MAGDHACPVCQARFTRPQHVTRHMRSHTGDRPYNCTQCGDRFARSDLLSRHVNKCHNGTPASTQRGGRRHTHTASSSVSSTNSVNLAHPNPAETPCDACLGTRQQCDLGSPCGKCILTKSQCTYTAKARSVASGHARRVSLPSLTQASQQPPCNLLGQAPQAGLGSYNQSSGLGLPPYGLGQYGQSNGVGFAGASTLDRSAVPGSLPPLSGAQPVPMPNGQYIDNYSTYPSMFGNDQQQQSSLNGLGGSLPRLGSLSYAGQPSQQPDTQFSSRPPSLEQAYDFGNSNMLPSLSQGFDGSTDPKAAPAAYLQQRRGSLQLPGSQSHQQQQPFHYQAQGIDGLGGPPFHQSPQQPQAHGSPASLSRHFDPARINERLASIRGGYPAMDDGSSVSDFGSNNSGAPSPVPSSQSISGFSASSRPTSSAGSGGVGRDGAAAPSGETFTSSLQGAIPLPTPLQLGSFNAFQSQPNSMNDRTPGASTDAGGAGGKIFPPYQTFENMNLDEAASFAAAAKHASNHGTYGGSGTSSSWNPALGAPTPSHYPVLSAGGKERAINELKDFWAAFISEPLTGGAGGSGNNGNGHALQKHPSMPSLKTPLPLSSERTSMLDLNHPTPRTLYPSSGHQSMLGMMFKPEPSSLSSSSNNRPPNNNSNIKLDDPSEGSQSGAAASVQPPAPVIGEQEAENLRSYQEACLRRETPMLRLQARPKSRLLKSSSLSPQFGGDRKKLPGVDGMVGGESVQMKVDGSNTSSPSKAGSVSNVPVFAEPFAPDSKEARDWNHYRAQAAAATDLHQATTAAASRPSYKRLPSTTLGPETSKKSRDEGDADVTGSDAGYHVSYPQPGYNAATNAGGGAHGAWMRQRSMSSPSSMRPHFDWQSFGSQRA